MALPSGTRLGSYEIVAPLGAGGMGEVYRARDTKLNRDVAVKVLPEEFAADADRLARFSREAQVLASLNHPNIAAIYGIESHSTGSGQANALVMELVDGQDLSALIRDARHSAPAARPERGAERAEAERMGVGPHSQLNIEDTIAIAKQIVDALEAAHEAGIVHRDLKPGNVKVRADGTVKVLDFGLAKAMDPAGVSGVNPSNSPTLTARATQMGMVIGTAAYMAPEQARGRAVDRRADIWAFGVVLYEMLAGRRAFDPSRASGSSRASSRDEGDTVNDILASVLRDDVRWDALPADTPASLIRLLRRCLEKDPKRRLGWIGEARLTLEDPHAIAPASAGPVAAAPIVPLWRRALPWAVAALAIVVAAVVSAIHFQETPPVPVASRFEVKWPIRPGSTGGGAQFFQLSPDARSVAIVSDGYLWVRSLDAVEPVRLDRTQGATYPFWSPDSASIAFFAGGQLRTVSPAGGAVRTICDAADGRGGAWNTEGTIVFAGNSGQQGLSRVTDQGGAPVSLTKVSTSATSDAHRYPQFLPDNRHFLFLHLTGTTDVAGIYVGSLDGTPPVRVLDGAESALFAAGPGSADRGHLLFRRQDTLMAQAFDARTLQVSGPVIPVSADVSQGENTGLGAFSVAANGTLAHWAGGDKARELFWMSRAGSRQGVVVSGANIADFALSWDQRRVALTQVQSERGFESDVWLRTLDGGSPTRFTFGPPPGWMSATWSPKGDQIAYVTADQAGLSGYELFRKSLNMSAAVKLLRSNETIWLWDWSPDGKTLVYANGGELWLLGVEGEQKPVLLAKTPVEDQYAQFSPDGKWLAYSSGPRDHTEVFVQPLPVTGAFWQISQGGGDMPRWSRDGNELFYRARDGKLTALSYTTSMGAFEASATRTSLFDVASLGNIERFAYQPSRDGQRFLVNAYVAGAAPPVTMVLNWQAGLKR